MTNAGAPWALIDLFSGCGGMSAGLEASGFFECVYCADNDKWANETYFENLGHQPDNMDLMTLWDPTVRKAWVARLREKINGRPLLFAGGPPCQGFSSHVKVRGDHKGRNQLFTLFGELALEFQPEVILIENVADLVSARSWDLFSELRNCLTSAGYAVRAKIVNMAQFGVPQERYRTFVLASRDSEPTFPEIRRRSGEYSTVRDWIGGLDPVLPGQENSLDPMHVTSRHRQSTIDILAQVPIDGGSRPKGVGPACLDRTNGYADVYGRLAWDRPAPTLTTRCRTPSCGRFAHPAQNRGLTAREAGLLQTFPSTWTFCGPFDDRYKQIGNAVPPLAAQIMGEHIGKGMPSVENEVGVFEVEHKPVGSSFSILIAGIRRNGGLKAA